MASFVLTNARVEINAVDLSDHCKSVKVSYSKELKEATAMGDAGQRRLAGLADWSMEFEFYNDQVAGKTEPTFFPLVGVQTAVKVRAVNAAISATNVEYRGNGMIPELPVLQDGVGDVAMMSVKMLGSDGVALTRNTS